MVVIDKKILMFKIKEIHFCDSPFEVKGCDSVNFIHCRNKIDAEGFSCVPSYTSIIDLTQDLDTIWKNMSYGNCRKPINRAERAGIKIKLNQNYDEFYEIYRSVRKIKALPGALLSIEDIKRWATLFVAELDGEIISGHGYVVGKDDMISWVIGSKRFEEDKERVVMVGNASKLIIWEAIKYGRQKGVKKLDMGTIASEEESERDEALQNINFFKQSFGGVTVNCYNYQKAYTATLRIAKKLHQLANRVK